jgi:hypothetical protein
MSWPARAAFGTKGERVEDIGKILLTVLGIAIVPAVGCAVVQLARRWPWVTFILLLALIALGGGALAYAEHD